VNEAQRETLRARLLDVIKPAEDSLRIYTLRGSRADVVEALGLDGYQDFRGPLVV
jgi:CRISPR/Cas system-associated endoribonuclease Cas2